jgi:hypothetical protein
VDFTGDSSWKPISPSDFGVCSDDVGLFGPKNDNKGICVRAKRARKQHNHD